MTPVDHIVWAVPDLAAGADEFRRRTGVEPVAGGSHTGRGTANHLVGLGGASYLEIIGPDPGQPEPGQPRPFGIDTLTGPRVVAWCARPADLDATVATAIARGYDPGPIAGMSRRRPDGIVLSWRLTPPAAEAGGAVPFLIDWLDSPHPTEGDVPRIGLLDFRAEHPEPDAVRARLAALGVELLVRLGPVPKLVVALDGRDGPVELS